MNEWMNKVRRVESSLESENGDYPENEATEIRSCR